MKTVDNRFEHAYVLNVIAEDRPGIVATVTKAISRLEGNIDACSQTVLHGYFTLIMVVSFPRQLDTEELLREVAGPPDKHRDYRVQVMPLNLQTAGKEKYDSFVITAFGPDREGIVLRFSRVLADKGINIVDLFGDRTGEQFVLIGQLQVPKRWDIAMLQADLEQIGRESGYTVRLQHEDVFVATNQLRLSGQHKSLPVT
jgi:glycine cleavage system transcriptional repressor